MTYLNTQAQPPLASAPKPGRPIALAMAIRGRKDVREHPEAYSGADNLTAGLVLGAIGTALLALYLLMVAVLLVIVVAAA